MASPTEWHDDLTIALPGATQDLIEQQLGQTIREFARRSGVWMEEQTTKIRAGRDTYDFSKVPQGNAVTVMSVAVDGTQIPVADAMPSFANLTGNYAYVTSPGIIRIQPTPTQDITGGLQVNISYMPLKDATSIPEEFVNQWYEVILDGVKSRMMGLPGKPFSNVQLAAFHAAKFTSGISEARDVARRRYSKSESSWTYPRWA